MQQYHVLVSFFLLPNVRQVRDQYFNNGGGGGSLQNFPTDFDPIIMNGHHQTSTLSDTKSNNFAMVQPEPSVLASLPPQTPILMAATPTPSQQPQQQLQQQQQHQPSIGYTHPQVQQFRSQQNFANPNMSDDSLPSAFSLQVPIMDPNVKMHMGHKAPPPMVYQQSPSMGRRRDSGHGTIDSSSSSRGTTGFLEPMSLPKTPQKLVPGRMTTQRDALSRSNSQSNMKAGGAINISSTAV